MSVDELKKAVVKLSKKDRAKFIAWIEEVSADAWDRQIERDAKSGKLDRLFEAAMEDLRAGRVKKSSAANVSTVALGHMSIVALITKRGASDGL